MTDSHPTTPLAEDAQCHPEQARCDALATRLVQAFHDGTLPVARRWQYGTVDARMIGLTVAADTDREYAAFATVAVAHATWHSGRATPHSGKHGTNVGRAMRQLGNTGAYGPRDPRAVRALDRLMVAGMYSDLHQAVALVAQALREVDHPPHWATLAADLTQWQASPDDRDTVRARWARGFHTATPKDDPREG